MSKRQQLKRVLLRELHGSKCELCGGIAQQDHIICGACEQQYAGRFEKKNRNIVEVTI